jgi:putative pyruvate formate lyase activating enzyme
MWEEPCISGKEGSGTIFFTGCSMGCVFCQNYDISHEKSGLPIDEKRLIEIFYELKEKGANNINLVTADIYIPTVADAIRQAKDEGFCLPFVLNTSSYIEADTLKMLEGLIDIYLPDFKYIRSLDSKKYALAPDYPEVAKLAIAEMVRQINTAGGVAFDDRNMMKRGVIVRHLLMPGKLLSAKMIIKYLYETYGDSIYISLMNQYTPLTKHLKDFPELSHNVSEREYDELVDYAYDLGVRNGFIQEGGTVSESFIPEFDFEGVLKDGKKK